MSKESSVKIIDNVLNYFRNQLNITILFVVSLQNENPNQSRSADENISSYSSDAELNEFVTGLKTFVSFVDFSYSEKEFIGKLVNAGFADLESYKKIVYTDTASGTARSKSALTPALCEYYGLNYCSNDIFTAALLDNKMATYGFLKSLQLPVPETWFYSHKVQWINGIPPKDKKLIAKPAYGCASQGINTKSVSTLTDEFTGYIHQKAIEFNQPMMVQEFIEGYEVEVPIFDLAEPFAPGAVGISYASNKLMGNKIFTYENICDDDFQLFDFHLIDADVTTELKTVSCKAYSNLQLKGPVRFDYRIDSKTGKLYLMDFNNSPHLGKKHSFAYSIDNLGYSYGDMLKLIVYPALISS